MYDVKKHIEKIKKHNSAKYRLLTDYNYDLNVGDNEEVNVSVNIENIRYKTSSNYKAQLKKELNKYLKELVFEFYVRYGIKTKNINIKIDEKSYE